ncbi:MAG: EAL domain-containing response regulator [Rhizobiaceae bacterium]
MRVFVLDDDPIFLTVMDGLLRTSGGAETICETDAATALKRVSELAPTLDLLVTDLNMPGVDGLAFLRGLSDLNFGRPVLLVTGERDRVRNSAQQLAANLGLNIVGSVKKPVDLASIGKILELAKKNAVRPARSAPAEDTGPFEPQLYYQPQIDIRTGKIVAAEALVRGQTPSGRVIGAGAVLSAHSGREARFLLTTQLFALLCRDCTRLRDAGANLHLSFNIDTHILEHPDFFKMIGRTARENGVDPHTITMELTEKQLTSDANGLLEKIARLGMAGFTTSLDDFGTGASNYDLLRQGAFDELKIDHSIVNRVDRDPMSLSFVEFAVDLARTLGMRLIAEGVEDQDCAVSLSRLGIRWMQGYHFSRPLQFHRLIQRLDSEGARKLA